MERSPARGARPGDDALCANDSVMGVPFYVMEAVPVSVAP